MMEAGYVRYSGERAQPIKAQAFPVEGNRRLSRQVQISQSIDFSLYSMASDFQIPSDDRDHHRV